MNFKPILVPKSGSIEEAPLCVVTRGAQVMLNSGGRLRGFKLGFNDNDPAHSEGITGILRAFAVAGKPYRLRDAPYFQMGADIRQVRGIPASDTKKFWFARSEEGYCYLAYCAYDQDGIDELFLDSPDAQFKSAWNSDGFAIRSKPDRGNVLEQLYEAIRGFRALIFLTGDNETLLGFQNLGIFIMNVMPAHDLAELRSADETFLSTLAGARHLGQYYYGPVGERADQEDYRRI